MKFIMFLGIILFAASAYAAPTDSILECRTANINDKEYSALLEISSDFEPRMALYYKGENIGECSIPISKASYCYDCQATSISIGFTREWCEYASRQHSEEFVIMSKGGMKFGYHTTEGFTPILQFFVGSHPVSCDISKVDFDRLHKGIDNFNK